MTLVGSTKVNKRREEDPMGKQTRVHSAANSPEKKNH